MRRIEVVFETALLLTPLHIQMERIYERSFWYRLFKKVGVASSSSSAWIFAQQRERRRITTLYNCQKKKEFPHTPTDWLKERRDKTEREREREKDNCTLFFLSLFFLCVWKCTVKNVALFFMAPTVKNLLFLLCVFVCVVRGNNLASSSKFSSSSSELFPPLPPSLIVIESSLSSSSGKKKKKREN